MDDAAEDRSQRVGGRKTVGDGKSKLGDGSLEMGPKAAKKTEIGNEETGWAAGSSQYEELTPLRFSQASQGTICQRTA